MLKIYKRNILVVLVLLIGVLFTQSVLAASTANSIKNEIIPVVPPTIIYANHSAVTNGGPIIAVGMTATNTKIVVQLLDDQNKIIEEKNNVSVDSNGHWIYSTEKSLDLGDYRFSIIALDKNNISSLPVVSEITVEPKSAFIFGGFEINQVWFFLGLIILLSMAFVIGWYSYDNWFDQLGRKVTIAKRDVNNLFNNIDDDINELLKNYASSEVENCDFGQIRSLLNDIKNNIEKSRHYIVDNIRGIGK